MLVVICKEVRSKALSIFSLCLSLVPGLLIVMKAVDLLMPPLVTY
jgi:hypothetical protein